MNSDPSAVQQIASRYTDWAIPDPVGIGIFNRDYSSLSYFIIAMPFSYLLKYLLMYKYKYVFLLSSFID
jgi:hypothetical protein